MSDETVTFEFPRELVEQADVVNSRVYWERLVEDENAPAASKLMYLTYIQILDWQEANRYRVTPETPNGTEVEIVEEPQLVPVYLVGPDPLEPDGYAVVVTREGKLYANKWEELRRIEPLTKGDNDE